MMETVQIFMFIILILFVIYNQNDLFLILATISCKGHQTLICTDFHFEATAVAEILSGSTIIYFLDMYIVGTNTPIPVGCLSNELP